jgi:hypothetical protein
VWCEAQLSGGPARWRLERTSLRLSFSLCTAAPHSEKGAHVTCPSRGWRLLVAPDTDTYGTACVAAWRTMLRPVTQVQGGMWQNSCCLLHAFVLGALQLKGPLIHTYPCMYVYGLSSRLLTAGCSSNHSAHTNTMLAPVTPRHCSHGRPLKVQSLYASHQSQSSAPLAWFTLPQHIHP